MSEARMNDPQYIKDSCQKVGAALTEKQVKQFYRYYELLTEWNQVMNLTAITEYEEVILKHFVDSIALIQVQDMTKPKTIIDVGTGAGFPGIPLKIVCPQLKVTLLDSLNKRVKFLSQVITELELEGIEAIHGRAEDMAHKAEYREQYEISISRAVANLASLSEYCIPYVKMGGYFISYKSGNIGEEVQRAQKAIQILGGKIEVVKEFTLPDSDIVRSFVIVRKEKNTGKKYPRKAGTPAKNPIS
jgi:16S rRNA (guanine527-N7)-methyltransferase